MHGEREDSREVFFLRVCKLQFIFRGLQQQEVCKCGHVERNKVSGIGHTVRQYMESERHYKTMCLMEELVAS